MPISWLTLLLALPLLAQQPAVTRLSLSNIPARDASILADADSRTYYLYASAEAPAGGVVAYKSKDLASWEGPVSVFQATTGGWANAGQGAQDPEVHAYRGKYYLFATLFNKDKIIAKPPESWRVNATQGTQVLVSESPQGPFSVAPGSADAPYTPANFVAQGGTLYVEGDLAWLIYAHDWTQTIDATIEAVRLKADLTAPVGDALYLFKASDAPWLQQQTAASKDPRYYPASGPFAYRTRNGSLIMIWSSPQEREIRGESGPLRDRQAPRAVEADRHTALGRQHARHDFQDLRWTADAGRLPARRGRPKQGEVGGIGRCRGHAAHQARGREVARRNPMAGRLSWLISLMAASLIAQQPVKTGHETR